MPPLSSPVPWRWHSDVRYWTFLLGGVIVWAVDFFLLYAIASIFLTTPLARVLAIIVTLGALAADSVLIWIAWNRHRTATDDYRRWFATLALLSAAISMLAVLWQGFPAILA